ncbi:MAG: alcohol dehydrogenase catalytic domain-containing protein [Planctomycetota bacterium]|nr:alcohol dehydrogenase catalytic domain-containing protein [Planctomycetota bacterium]
MKALQCDGREATIVERAEPVPAPDDCLLRPVLASITRAERDVVRGVLAHTGVLGHEFVAVVERVEKGPGAGPVVRAGARVVGSPIVPCAACTLCTRGLSAHCADRRVLGLWRLDGCLAERFTLPGANLVEVPKALPDESALFAGVVASALRVAQSVRIEGKTYVTVLGDGVVGLVTAQVLARLNASVRLLGTHPEKFALCEKWGVKHRHVCEVGRRRDQDIVVDCTGAPEALTLALGLVRPRGTIVARSAPPFVPPGAINARAGHSAAKGGADGGGGAGNGGGADLTPAVGHEISIVGVGAAASAGLLREALDVLAKGDVDTSPLISRRVRLAHAPDALAGEGALRVVVGF